MSNPFEPYDFAKIRLYVEAELSSGLCFALNESQSHYLRNVMRQSVGDHILAFDGTNGEWLACITELTKKSVRLEVAKQSRKQDVVPNVELIFAPVKRARLDFLVQKATELGVAALQPVMTERTVVSRLNTDRMRANVIEAAEQCGRMTVPTIHEVSKLVDILRGDRQDRQLVFCDEARQALPMAEALAGTGSEKPCAIMIGPEGGFSPSERAEISARGNVLPVSLGPRIMRADTAALAALAIWQSICGDLH